MKHEWAAPPAAGVASQFPLGKTGGLIEAACRCTVVRRATGVSAG